MTVATAMVPSANGHRPEIDDVRAAARDAYGDDLAAGRVVTGAELGRRFGMSERWGRARIAEVRRDITDDRDDPTRSRDSYHQSLDGEHRSRDDVPTRVAAETPTVVVTTEPTTVDRSADHSWLDSSVTLVVAAVAAAASYGHMLHVALLAGEPLWIARAWPITVDGLVLAALRSGHRGRTWLVVGLLVSVAANVLAQYPHYIAAAGPVVAAWPPVALFGTHRLLHGRQPTTSEDRTQP